MIVVLIFRSVDRVVNAAIRHLGLDSRLGAWVAYWSGRIIFWQLDYVERIEKLSGWTPVQVQTPPKLPYTLSINGVVRHGYFGDTPSLDAPWVAS